MRVIGEVYLRPSRKETVDGWSIPIALGLSTMRVDRLEQDSLWGCPFTGSTESTVRLVKNKTSNSGEDEKPAFPTTHLECT